MTLTRVNIIFCQCSIDFMRNNFSHIRSRHLRRRTRRLCNPQAMTITKSEKSPLVLRKRSFTIRDRFTPAMACSTRTRTRDSLRLCRFCHRVNAPWRGFFSVAASGALLVHSLESQYPCTGSSPGDSESLQYRRSSCRGSCPHTSDSNSRPVWSSR